MTGGWAATNTLRANAQHFLDGVGGLIPGAIRPGGWMQTCIREYLDVWR